MKKAVLIFSLVLLTAVVAAAQARTVTNSTLQKFQDKRVAAEREYRENYARLGLPSPEEIDRQREEDLKTKIELSEQLRQARLEKERLELERGELDANAGPITYSDSEERGIGFYGGSYNGVGGYYPDGRFGRRYGRFNRNLRTGGGYRATPVGVYADPSRRRVPFFSNGRNRGGSVIIRGRKR